MITETFALKDVCIKITDGSHFSPKDQDEGFVMLSSKDMLENGFDYSDVKYISEADYQKLVNGDCKPLKNDILIIKDGNSYLKRIFLIKEEREEVVLSSIAIVRPNTQIVEPAYLTYFLKSNKVKDEMALFLSGAAIPRIILDDFKKVKVSLPPLPIQRRIAEILGHYDALIENYQKQISALESMAQELYREWFVRGRCPYAQAGEDGELPAGWEKANLFEIANITYGFPFNSSLFSEEQEGIKVVRIRDVLSGTSNTFTTEEAPPKYLLNNGDILVGMDGEFHISKWNGGKAYLNQRVLKLEPKNNLIPRYFLLLAIKSPIQFLNSVIVGTTVAHLGDSDLKKIEIVVPDKQSLEVFRQVTDSFYDKEINLQSQLTLLRQTRDALLPKLLSGQLPVRVVMEESIKE